MATTTAEDVVAIAILSDSEDEGPVAQPHAAMPSSQARRKRRRHRDNDAAPRPRAPPTEVMEVVDLTKDDDDADDGDSDVRGARAPRSRHGAHAARVPRPAPRSRRIQSAPQRTRQVYTFAPFAMRMAQLLRHSTLGAGGAPEAPYYQVPEHLRNPQAAAVAAQEARAQAARRASDAPASAAATDADGDDDDAERSGQTVTAIKCPVCLESVNEPVSTSCGHVFCSTCLHECMKKKKQCPQCRKRLTRRQVHRLFF